MGLRILIYDDTCRSKGLRLTYSWIAGARLYRALGRFDAEHSVTSWTEGLDAVLAASEHERISEIQYWGHGKWGLARVGDERLDLERIENDSAIRDRLIEIRDRLCDDALLWFRTCETFGAERGHEFSRSLSALLNCDVAGHTYIIGPWQSGLHRLRRGAKPSWDPREGLIKGDPQNPHRAAWSRPLAPNTITCFRGDIPAGF